MPPHRKLARRLGVSVGTVTRVYAQAERLGLLNSTVGRGTFVSSSLASSPNSSSFGDDTQSQSAVDLSLNLPLIEFATPRIAEALEHVAQRPDFASSLTVTPHAGVDWHRQTLAAWFRKAARFDGIDWKKLLVTTGAQHALSLVLETLTSPGDTVLTEAATFSGFRTLAEYHGVKCAGMEMDEEGMRPDALETAVVATGSKVVYLLPTLQNPTTRTMSRQRREDIVRIARAHDLTLIEDDVYAPLAFGQCRSAGRKGSNHADLVPLASLAPERTCYVSSVSKFTAMGLRAGILVAPDEPMFDRLKLALRASCYTASPVSSLIACQLIKDGAANDILNLVAQEAMSRMELANRLMGNAIEEPSFPTSLHAWMPMPELRAERIANGALRRGVVLTPPSSFVVNGDLVSGLRLCLNFVSRSDLERALRALRSAIADEFVPSHNAIV